MKALTMTQPFATLIGRGALKLHLLPWHTDYRGPVAIHAAEVYPQHTRELALQPPLRDLLDAAGLHHWIDMPIGAVVAVARLVDCRCVEPADGREGGRYAWCFEDARLLPEPVIAPDAIGLWDWAPPAELADAPPFSDPTPPRSEYIGGPEEFVQKIAA